MRRPLVAELAGKPASWLKGAEPPSAQNRWGWARGWANPKNNPRSNVIPFPNNSNVVHEEGLEPPHLAVPEPKGHMKQHDGAGSGNHARRDAACDANVHEGPGDRRGWATGQGSTE